MEKLLLIGGGGHSRSCIDVVETIGKYQIIGIIDSKLPPGEKVLGYPILGGDDKIQEYVKEVKNCLIAVGQVKSFNSRMELYYKLKSIGAIFPCIISPRAHVSKYSELGEGTIVMHDALINANAKVGKNCIINTKALLEHDVLVGDFCHISTASVLNGGANIGNCTFIGSNSVTKEGVKVGDRCIVSAGMFIKNNLASDLVLK